MLAFDLETSGLNPREALITCAAVSDPDAGIERVFFFARLEGGLLVLLCLGEGLAAGFDLLVFFEFVVCFMHFCVEDFLGYRT